MKALRILFIKLSLVSLILGCGAYSVIPNTTKIPKIIINPATKMVLHSPDSSFTYFGYEGLVVQPIHSLSDPYILIVKGNEQVLVQNPGINANGIGNDTIQIAHVIWEAKTKRVAFVVDEPACILKTYETLLKQHGFKE